MVIIDSISKVPLLTTAVFHIFFPQPNPLTSITPRQFFVVPDLNMIPEQPPNEMQQGDIIIIEDLDSDLDAPQPFPPLFGRAQ